MSHTTKIREIKNLDAFDSFAWNGKDLKRLNLIYGWNGSGKTTVSRIFNFLERREIHIPDFASVDFSVVIASGNIRKQDLSTHSLDVRVFNEDFVKENLGFDGSTAKKIIILGKENVAAKGELDNLITDHATKKSAYETLLGQQGKLPRLDTVLTDAGRAVTQEFGNTPFAHDQYYGRSYNRSRIDQQITDGSVTAANLAALILSADRLATCRDAIKTKRGELSVDVSELKDFSALFSAANTLVQNFIEVGALSALEEDQPLREWTETGYHLHKDRAATECLFCHKPLDASLLSTLGRFFTDELVRTKAEIDLQIAALRRVWSGEKPFLPDSFAIYPDLAKDYVSATSAIDTSANVISDAIGTLLGKLSEKKEKLHDNKVKIMPVAYPVEAIDAFNQGLKTVGTILVTHNDRVSKSEEEGKRAAKALELHTIASTLSKADFFRNKEEADALGAQLTSAKEAVERVKAEIAEKRAALQDAAVAVDRINAFLKEFFGEGEIYLEFPPADEEQVGYLLKSRGKPARFLSEGEKSVIALSYFFIKLEEEGCDRTKCVIVIDDPVDSQDSVFLFRTFSLLKRQLQTAGQLILMTHNFEFFNLARDWLTGRKAEDDFELFQISLNKTPNAREATVEDLPVLLRSYKSEYQYLFCRLHQYANGVKSLDEPLVANIARKVLEYFASFKWSCKTTEQFTSIVLSRFVEDQEQLKRGTGDFVVKFLHEYSHGQDFSRPISAPMFESKAIAENVLRFIKLTDEEHYKALAKMCRETAGAE